MNIILFNGPPRSGKDTAAKFAFDFINTKYRNRYGLWEKFSFPNKRAFAGMMGLACDAWGVVEPYEAIKDRAIPNLGFSYRQWQIDYSERFMKPLYGKDIFGRLLLDRLSCFNLEKFIPVVSDCGFQVECDVLKGHNVLLFTMSCKGCTFEGDSREWVRPYDGWRHYFCNNDYPLDQLKDYIEELVADWLR